VAYLTELEYKNFNLPDVPREDFNMLADFASALVDVITMGNITDFKALKKPAREKVKKATAYYVLQLYNQGGADAVTGFSASFTQNSVSLGSTTVSSGGVRGGGAASHSNLGEISGIVRNPIADSLLESAGLCYRGVGV